MLVFPSPATSQKGRPAALGRITPASSR